MKQSLQNIIADAIARLEYRIILPKGTQRDEIDAAISVFTSEHKKFLWFSHPYSFNEESKELCLRYNFTPKIFFKPESEKTVNSIFQSDKIKTSSDFDKVLFVYKWIASQIPIYGLTGLIDSNLRGLRDPNAISLLYAKTAQCLLGSLSVESYIVFGKLHCSNADNSTHEWVMAKIDNHWYHIDFCLANPYLMRFFIPDEKPINEDGVIWNYFCRSTDYMLKNRSIDFIEDYPCCIRNLDGISKRSSSRYTATCLTPNLGFCHGTYYKGNSNKGIVSKTKGKVSAFAGIVSGAIGVFGAAGSVISKIYDKFVGSSEDEVTVPDDPLEVIIDPNDEYRKSLVVGCGNIPKFDEDDDILNGDNFDVDSFDDVVDLINLSEEDKEDSLAPSQIPITPPRVASCDVNACIYAPAEVRYNKSFIIRVYLYEPQEKEDIDAKVKEIDPTAEKKDYKLLDLPVKEGDKITVQLKLSEGVTCKNNTKSVVWRNRFTDCAFMAKLTDSDLENIEGEAYVFINDIPAGEMLFIIDVVESQPGEQYSNVESHRFSKIFISYAHQDEIQVKGIAEGCRMLGKDYFFDRHTLHAGDLFKEKIFNYIDTADLFVLCWSKNAAQSEWVKIEREYALQLIQNGKSSLSIYPLCLRPEAPLPLDMSDKYNFGSL